MPYITKDQLKTHVYPWIVDVITGSDDTIVDEAIAKGVSEAKSFLNRYDKTALFGSPSADPTFHDSYLDSLVKDLIVWQLIKLANPNIDLQLARTSYEDARKALAEVMAGKTDPEWPLRQDGPLPTSTLPNGVPGGEGINNGLDAASNIEWNSNRRRPSHW